MAKKRKRLTKSKQDKIVSGVIGGVAEYLNIDSTLLRIIWLIAVAFTAFIPGVTVYAISIFIVPKK